MSIEEVYILSTLLTAVFYSTHENFGSLLLCVTHYLVPRTPSRRELYIDFQLALYYRMLLDTLQSLHYMLYYVKITIIVNL